MSTTLSKIVVAENVKRVRRSLGQTQEKFSEMIGIKRSLLGAYEEGRAVPNSETLRKIAEIEGVTMDAILFTPLSCAAKVAVGFKPKSRYFEGEAKIYTLSDEQGNIFYVGCTVLPIRRRLNQHICDAKTNKGGAKNEKVRELNYKIEITIVDKMKVSGKNKTEAMMSALDKEREWMYKCEQEGHTLCNSKSRTILAVDTVEPIGLKVANF